MIFFLFLGSRVGKHGGIFHHTTIQLLVIKILIIVRIVAGALNTVIFINVKKMDKAGCYKEASVEHLGRAGNTENELLGFSVFTLI